MQLKGVHIVTVISGLCVRDTVNVDEMNVVECLLVRLQTDPHSWRQLITVRPWIMLMKGEWSVCHRWLPCRHLDEKHRPHHCLLMPQYDTNSDWFR